MNDIIRISISHFKNLIYWYYLLLKQLKEQKKGFFFFLLGSLTAPSIKVLD